MKKFALKLLEILSPSAFKLGLIITLGVTWASYKFYTTPPQAVVEGSWLSLIKLAHQKSIDYRMQDRGETAAHPDVAIVTVDEKSIETLGRWPWSRDKISRVIEELRINGAKLVAFDAIFSEADQPEALKSLNRIKESGFVSGAALQLVDTEILNSNKDLVLAETIETHAEHLIMGSYFDDPNDQYYPYQELCGQLILAKTKEYQRLSNQALPVMVLDEAAYELPSVIKTYVETILSGIEESTRQAELKSGPKNEIDIRDKIRFEQENFCDRWLTEKDESLATLSENWNDFRESDPSLAQRELAEVIDEIKYGKSPTNMIHRTGRVWMNIPDLSLRTKHTGYFNAFLDSDGTIRRTRLIARHGDILMPSLSLLTSALATQSGLMVEVERDPTNPAHKTVKSIAFTNLETGEPTLNLPVDESGGLAINYRGPRYMFPYLSIAELLSPKKDIEIIQRTNGIASRITVNKAQFIKDKIFIFGATATGIYDLRVTPFDENFPGVETHANIIDNILTRNFLIPMKNEGPKIMGLIFVLGLMLSFLIAQLGATQGLLTILGASSALYVLDKFYLFKNGIVMAIIFPLILIFCIYIVLTFFKYLTEEKKKKALKGTFEKYVSPQIVKEILRSPENVELGGRKQKMSVMFSDVRGFTTISEKLDPQVLTLTLNTYLTPMTRLVFQTNGTLDKYMGDAIMAFWGAPIYFPNHAQQACRCALQMMEKLGEIQKDFEKRGLPRIDIGIGINTGEMSVGNMGSDIVRSYTVMGDSVNLGSRLEGINKQYGTNIIISEFTYEEIKNEFIAREVDWVRVKGKAQPVRIFELISEKTRPYPKQTMLDHFQQGFELYHRQLWDQAIDSFNQALNLDPTDNPSKLYLERCMQFRQTPPEANWDGVYDMKTK